MDAPGAVTSSASNIGFRESSVQVDNNVATLQWFTETISSRNRDKTLWESPSQYTVPLSKRYPRVLEVELLSAEFPRSTYVIEEKTALYGSGNNSFKFAEGFEIRCNGCADDNDRLVLYEYTEIPNPCLPPRCPVVTQECVVHFPTTFTPIERVHVLGRNKMRVVTQRPHEFTCNFVANMWLTGLEERNGAYCLKEVTGPCEFIAVPSECDGPEDSSFSLSSFSSSTSSSSSSSSGACCGTVIIPRVPSPCALALLVEQYVNQRAEPRTLNNYSVTFNASTGKFVFDRSFGSAFFDVLAGSDERSVFPTMGFSAVDYRYGNWAMQNVQQTVLPSEQYQAVLRPTIASETVGESALVSVSAGNYTPATLAAALTREMQRPLICKGENDLLVAQLLGQCVHIHVPPGMYTPETLIEAIAFFLTKSYRELCHDSSEKFCGFYVRDYGCDTGVYQLRTRGGAVFGLLFSCSTIGALLGFACVDLTGCCEYSSTRSVIVPIANGRYTSGIYRVVADADRLRFRFLKCGQYQAPVVKVEMRNDCSFKFTTWSCRAGGAAHGFQVGDVVRVDGPCKSRISGVHIVTCVEDAFTFHVGGDGGGGSSSSFSLTSVFEASSESFSSSSSSDSSKHCATDHFVVSHWDQPFFLHFPGVPNTIAEVVGFPFAVSDRGNYEGPHVWNFLLRSNVFLNIQHLTDGEYSRVYKTHNSGPQNKYTISTMTSFVRIPMCTDTDCGQLATSSFARQKRFIMNSVDFSQLSISIVGADGNLVNFNGRDHSFDLRFLTEQ